MNGQNLKSRTPQFLGKRRTQRASGGDRDAGVPHTTRHFEGDHFETAPGGGKTSLQHGLAHGLKLSLAIKKKQEIFHARDSRVEK
jgi:hypothetical protein